jgi:hypothetical protein
MLPHGESSGFESGAGLSIPWVRLSSLDGVAVSDNTFLCHTLFVGLLVSISFFSSSSNFLRWILRFMFRWLCTLLSSRIRRHSTNSMRASMDGVNGFSGSFSDFFFRLNVLTYEHCSTFSLKANLSFCPLMLSWISQAPTSMCAFTVLKNSLPRIRGSWC